MNLLWLGDPKSFDASLVGGKAANLSRLARLGGHHHLVLDGFFLPVAVVDERTSDEQVEPIDYRSC
jgi:hypothetical protein